MKRILRPRFKEFYQLQNALLLKLARFSTSLTTKLRNLFKTCQLPSKRWNLFKKICSSTRTLFVGNSSMPSKISWPNIHINHGLSAKFNGSFKFQPLICQNKVAKILKEELHFRWKVVSSRYLKRCSQENQVHFQECAVILKALIQIGVRLLFLDEYKVC